MARIGFIAVSGVRVYNQRLVAKGLTLPGFVERAQVVASMPSLGLLTLAGLTPSHHHLQYLEMGAFDRERLDALEVDLVAISSFTAKASVMYQIADHLRRRGVAVVLGGLHCTMVPQEATAHADAVVVGEGEPCWPSVLADFERGQLQPTYRSLGSRAVCLDDIPVPRFDLLDIAAYNRIPLQTTRGCPLHCEFCASSRVLGPFRTKSVERVRDELRAVTRLWPKAFVELADDNTFVDKTWSKELVHALGDSGVHWFTETDVSVADDAELLDRLADSGCRQLLIGLEATSEGALNGIDSANWKMKRVSRYRHAIDAIQSRGISVNGCFIFGLDEHGPEVFEDVTRFVESAALTEVQATLLTPFPGTRLYRRLEAEGRLLFPGEWDRCTLFDVTFRPRHMSVAELETGFENLMTELYSPQATKRRRRLFARFARHALEAA